MPCSCVVALSTLLAIASGAANPWERVGPRNIFDDDLNRGEAGTLADAASPASNPSLIYSGGRNNGASSGILKTTDMGKHWVQSSKGLFDTRVYGVFLHPDDAAGRHVLVGTPTGVWESKDGAESWSHINGTEAFGLVWSFRAGVINNEPYVMAGTTAGIANVPVRGGSWSVIPSPAGDWTTPLSIAVDNGESVVVGCLQGSVFLGRTRNTTAADWTPLPDVKCAVVAIDPNDKNHFLYSNSTGWQTWESTDGGKTVHNLNHPTGSFYVAVDGRGWYYTGAEAGAYRSMDGGKSWQPYVVNMTSRAGYIDNRIPHDYQRIVLDFAGDGVAFPSDQGLFIKPPGDATSLINACGDMSNNIAIRLAVSTGDGNGNLFLVTTMWDWAPIASWNSGKDWPATPCAYWDTQSCDGAPSSFGEGGAAYSMGRSNRVVMLHYSNIYWSAFGGKNMTHVVIPNNANTHSSVLIYARKPGSRSEPDGRLFTVMTMDVNDTSRSPSRGLRDDDDENKMKYMVYGEQRDVRVGGPWEDDDKTAKFVLRSMNFGENWTWTRFPEHLQDVTVMEIVPTDAGTLYAVAPGCLARSTDDGNTWGPCINATGLEGSFSSLIAKDAKTMLLLRNGDVPLRTRDGGASWQPLKNCASISTGGYTRAGSYSWSGNTLVIHGRDTGAPTRGQYGSYVWKSRDDGDTWVDETADLVTMSPNAGTWFGEDFYLTSSGEGILVKRGFDA